MKENLRKKLYFAGHMEIDFDNKEVSNLSKDYRMCLIEDINDILYPFDEPIPLNDEYSYGYPPFYYYDENGNPSLDSNLIVDTEIVTIKETDILVAYLQEKATSGTLGEIMYAAFNNIPTYIYYMPSDTESDVYNTNQWYVILMAKKLLKDNCFVKEVFGIKELLQELEVDFGIKAVRYPSDK